VKKEKAKFKTSGKGVTTPFPGRATEGGLCSFWRGGGGGLRRKKSMGGRTSNPGRGDDYEIAQWVQGKRGMHRRLQNAKKGSSRKNVF